jgi:hypothetical protein
VWSVNDISQLKSACLFAVNYLIARLISLDMSVFKCKMLSVLDYIAPQMSVHRLDRIDLASTVKNDAFILLLVASILNIRRFLITS